ncbi:MAG: hypothetical protein ABWZ02_00420 [Nakamurella sp.]
MFDTIWGHSLRMVVWNAGMAVHRKLQILVDELHPDVLVLSECANEEMLTKQIPSRLWNHMKWVGSYKHKGLAVLTFGEYEIANLTPIEPILEWVMALEIQGTVSFQLIAVWAMNQRASNIADFPRSNPQPAAALDAYWTDASGPTIIAGDFNHNVRWDKPGTPEKNHGRTLAAAGRAGLTSAYHHARNEEQGAETEPTLYWHGRYRRKVNGPDPRGELDQTVDPGSDDRGRWARVPPAPPSVSAGPALTRCPSPGS